MTRQRRREITPEKLATRRLLLVGAFLLAALLIVGRSVQLQAIEGERWASIAEEQQRAREPLPARRGGLFDRDGIPLAISHPTFAVSIAPREIRGRAAAVETLVRVLGIPKAQALRATDPKRQWSVLPGRYTAEQRRELSGLRGIHLERKLERVRPQREIAREVIGAVAVDGSVLGGVEQELNSVLKGSPGYSILRRDARGEAQPTVSLPVAPPVDGADVYLTLDFDLQEIADGALRTAIDSTGASGGDLLITDPHTGEILAAVSRRDGGTRSLSLITEPYEPGSTLKPFFVATLLAAQRASLGDRVFAENGSWRDEHGRTISDVHPYGWLTLYEALQVSSNIGIAKFVPRVNRGTQYRYLRDFGFGTPTGVEYPSESGGRLRSPAQWSAFSPASLAMGYEIAVTPLQLIMAYGALANGGVLMEPRLIREVRSADGELLYQMEPRALRRVVPRRVAEQVTDVLVSVVEEGTATRASFGDFRVAGKTGTARRTEAGGRYQSGSYTATFVGYFPARDPQLAILVKLDRPRGSFYGGTTAAPVTRETLQAILAARTSPLDSRGLLPVRTGNPSGNSRSGRRSPVEGEGPYVFFLDEPLLRPDSAAPPRRISVPSLDGLPLRGAVRRLHALGFQVRLQGSGAVARTIPGGGTELFPGDTVLIVGSDR